MEQRISITSLRSNAGKRLFNFTGHIFSVTGTSTISSAISAGGFTIPAISLVLSLMIGAMQPDYDPIKQTISQLVHYPYGWLQSIDFLILGVWLVFIAVKFYSDFTHKLTTKIAVLSMILVGIGFLLITIFPTNIPGSDKTLQAIIHEKTAQSVCFLFPVSCSLLVPEFRGNSLRKKLMTFTEVTAVTGFILFGVGVAITYTHTPLLGILERLIMLNAIIWLEIIGYHTITQQFNNRSEQKELAPVQQLPST